MLENTLDDPFAGIDLPEEEEDPWDLDALRAASGSSSTTPE